MPNPIRLVLALHNHQPVGNFDNVFEQAYRDSYCPFLDVFEQYTGLRFSLHVSGPLLEWLDEHHPEYVDRLADLVAADRIEILGGAFYEAILTMIPPRDRVGQIRTYTKWLHDRLGANVRGMWMPERVWEQCLVSDLADAGIQYTILDDFHFRNAGLTEEQLHGYYVSEDNGRLISIFPGSERLRYLIPFHEPHETIDYLASVAARAANAVVVFGDDGEKFGTWPDTRQHVYERGWLRRFFDSLLANSRWIHTTTLAEAVVNVTPLDKAYLPDGSYREMTEWALPTEQLVKYEELRHDMERDPRWPQVTRYVRGGFWRNFKVKYPEADEMYTRMIMVSNCLNAVKQEGIDNELVRHAQRELYRGQCNCSYWHGAFGGIYLPHLRHAVYNHLIAAENLLHRAVDRPAPWVEASAGDFNLDARHEVWLSNDRLAMLFSPVRGGQMYELDVRPICLNLLATLARREEAYHQKVRAGAGGNKDQVASIHDRVVFKQSGLEKRLQYDRNVRKSLLDHFYDNDVTLASVAAGEAAERGDFATGVYETKLRRGAQRIQVVLSRFGNAWGRMFRITKTVELEAGSPMLVITYELEDLPREPLHLGIEFNFAGLPAGAEDRYFHHSSRGRMGQLGSRLDLSDVNDIGLTDEYLGIDVGLRLSRPCGLWTFPVETVSQSEGGFELVHQSVVVQPHWLVTPDAQGRWQTTIHLHVDTSLAESRMQEQMAAAVA
jgi:hypothetical protein